MRANRRRSVEWRCAMCAKSGFGSVFGSALGAPLAERHRTLVAKQRARGIIGSAFRAAHRPPAEAKRLTRFLYHAPASKGMANQACGSQPIQVMLAAPAVFALCVKGREANEPWSS